VPFLREALSKGHCPPNGSVFIFDEKTDKKDHPDPSGHPSFLGGELHRSGFVLHATSKPDQGSSSPPGKGEWPQAEGVKYSFYHFGGYM